MSTTRSGKVMFKCMNDHSLGVVCDGHSVEIVQHHTSDTVNIFIDNDCRLIIDDSGWDALLIAARALDARNAGHWMEADKILESGQ